MKDRHSILLGFVRENAQESSTRLVMILCTLGGLAMARGVWVFAMKNPKETGSIGVLSGIVGTLIVSAAVAIAQRTRKGGEPGDAPPILPPPAGPQP
jgi:NhaP-type Na+/H+ or K+/H+ antiporter